MNKLVCIHIYDDDSYLIYVNIYRRHVWLNLCIFVKLKNIYDISGIFMRNMVARHHDVRYLVIALMNLKKFVGMDRASIMMVLHYHHFYRVNKV